MRLERLAALGLASAVIVGCSDGGSRDATSPEIDLRFAAGGAGSTAACSSTLGKAVSNQQSALYSGATLKTAQSLWSAVTHDCKTNLATAQGEMLTYVKFTIAQSLAYGGGSSNGLTVQHWNSVFQYVAYPPPNLADSVLSSQGGAAVVTNPAVGDSAEVRTIGPYAAIKIYSQDGSGDQRTHLISINPLNDGCLTGTNLIQHGPCFEFSANPHLSPGFSPKSVTGICQPVKATEIPGGISPGFGHQTGANSAEILSTVHYPLFCVDVVADLDAGSWHGGLKGIATRLAFLTRRALTPEPLYASHGGLGGTEELLSPFAAVDRMIFKSTFTADAVNTVPGTPERGRWATIIQAPGTILVQDTLGNLFNKPVVLSQAGGACANCGSLELRGFVNSSNNQANDTGIYFVDWDSLQDGPTVKAAPFILRSSDSTEIARVTYKSKSSKNLLFYNTTLLNSGWVQHVSQHFQIVVNFNDRTTTLSINGILAASGTISSQAHNIGRLSAEFSGIDSGIMGWDNITIERQVDQ
jgi:hypothetical protein